MRERANRAGVVMDAAEDAKPEVGAMMGEMSAPWALKDMRTTLVVKAALRVVTMAVVTGVDLDKEPMVKTANDSLGG
jgi:hypothetical protein